MNSRRVMAARKKRPLFNTVVKRRSHNDLGIAASSSFWGLKVRLQAPCSSSWEHCSKQYLDVDDVDTDTRQQNVCLKPLAQSSNSSSLGGKRYLFP